MDLSYVECAGVYSSIGASIKTDLRLCAVGGGRAAGAVDVNGAMLAASKPLGWAPSKLAVSVCAAPDPRPAWSCPRLETCGLCFSRIPKGPLSERESSRHWETKLGSCPCLCRVRPIHFSDIWSEDDGSEWPCTAQLFREKKKTFESWCLSCL